MTYPQAKDRRQDLFRESLPARLERLALGAAWAWMPGRAGGMPNLMTMMAREMLAPDRALPDAETALANPPGLAGIVHDFNAETVMEGFRRGLFPFAHIAPLKWWSPPQRSVLYFDELHIAKRLRRQMRQAKHTVTFDKDFEGVITACSERRPGRWHLTWVTPKVMRVFSDLFDAGHAHSFEVWNENNELVGGGYGLAVNGTFTTESQFSREANTSKMGFTVLNWHLAKWGYVLNDGKYLTPTTKDMNFREIPRAEFLSRLSQTANFAGKTGRWSLEADLAQIAEWQPDGKQETKQETKPKAQPVKKAKAVEINHAA